MIENETTELIKSAEVIVRAIFERTGRILPMYHAVHEDGRHDLIPAPSPDKDLSNQIMRAYFAHEQIARYVFVDECWRVQLDKDYSEKQIQKMMQKGASQHPDRIESVLFSGEDRLGQALAYCNINRSEKKPKLEPLFFDEGFNKMEGRMVGLLSRGTRQ